MGSRDLNFTEVQRGSLPSLLAALPPLTGTSAHSAFLTPTGYV